MSALTAQGWCLAQVSAELNRAREASPHVEGRAYHRGVAAGLYERCLREAGEMPPTVFLEHLGKAAALCAEACDLRGEPLRRFTEGMRVGRAIAGHVFAFEAGQSIDTWQADTAGVPA